MSNMKCPICQSNLHKINIIVSTCTNDKCKLWGSSIPNLVLGALAQAKQDLEHTRKALEITTDAIDEILYLDSGKFCKEPAEMWKIAKSAKDKITALEQKGSKNEQTISND